MFSPITVRSRLCHAVLALLVLAGLGIEYAVILAAHPGAIVSATVRYLSFFTILSNMLAGIASIGIVLGLRWAARPGLRAAITVYILVVALIFQLLLVGLVHLSPLGWWGNMLVHELVPAGWIACWLSFRPHGHIDRNAPVRWLIFPTLYGLWTLLHGVLSGFYPYPFLDVAKFGGLAVTRNMLVVALVFAGLGYAARWLDSGLAR
ncbi:MAG: hypothetical protein JWO65_1303 [Sphingomonas bacterium]|nr:hypothetical protein [Sphingomonas bacterium]